MAIPTKDLIEENVSLRAELKRVQRERDHFKNLYLAANDELDREKHKVGALEAERDGLREARKGAPVIVCLCGSSRFYDAYQRAMYDETMAGRIYLSIGFYPHSDIHREGVGHDSAEKVALDELHKRKIDLADEVLILNVGGYIGDSTRSELAYAYAHSKPVRWLEPEHAISKAALSPGREARDAR